MIQAAPYPYRHRYHQAVVYKLMNARKPDRVLISYPETLSHIKRVHEITGGLQQIVYLTGWQYQGHDSRYPAFFAGNPTLAPGDADPLDALRRLMVEARAYNAVVSVHINLCDAYENSPLWDEYRDRGLLRRNADGSLFKAGIWDGDQAYHVNKTREWQAGLTQLRLDRLLELLPLGEQGTVHIDVFVPHADAFYGTTEDEEVATLRAICDYLAERGVDVTIEWFKHELAGRVPMAWHLNLDEASRLRYAPAEVCGGGSAWHHRREHALPYVSLWRNPDIDVRFPDVWGVSIDRDGHDYLAEMWYHDLFTKTLPFLFLNQWRAREHRCTSDRYEVVFGDGIVSAMDLASGRLELCQDGRQLRRGDDLLLPAAWLPQTCFAYSSEGVGRAFELPRGWREYERVAITTVLGPDAGSARAIAVDEGRLSLRLAAGEAVRIEPCP